MNSGTWLFEKEGSKMNNIAYGSWFADTPIWIRVRATLVPVAETRYRLQCDVHLVRDRGGSTEEELPTHGSRRSSYQKLLEEVAARLKSG